MMTSLWFPKGQKIKHIFIKPLETCNHSFFSGGTLQMGDLTTILLSECHKACWVVQLNVTVTA